MSKLVHIVDVRGAGRGAVRRLRRHRDAGAALRSAKAPRSRAATGCGLRAQVRRAREPRLPLDRSDREPESRSAASRQAAAADRDAQARRRRRAAGGRAARRSSSRARPDRTTRTHTRTVLHIDGTPVGSHRRSPLSSVSPSASVSASPSASVSLSPSPSSSPSPIAPSAADNLGVAPVPPIQASPSEQAAPAAEPLALYKSAYDDLRAGRHEAAERGFREFVRRFPRHDYADNAQYWLGECFYDQKRYDKAAPEFRASYSAGRPATRRPTPCSSWASVCSRSATSTRGGRRCARCRPPIRAPKRRAWPPSGWQSSHRARAPSHNRGRDRSETAARCSPAGVVCADAQAQNASDLPSTTDESSSQAGLPTTLTQPAPPATAGGSRAYYPGMPLPKPRAARGPRRPPAARSRRAPASSSATTIS